MEALINMLDVLDPDPDGKPDFEGEEETDQDLVPWTLNREKAA